MGFYGSQLNYQMNAQSQNSMTTAGASVSGISLFQLQGMSTASQPSNNFFNASNFSSFGQGSADGSQGTQALLMQLLNLAWSQSTGSTQQQMPFRAPKQCSPSELKILLIELLQENEENCGPRYSQKPMCSPPAKQCSPAPTQPKNCEPMPPKACEPPPGPPKMEPQNCSSPAPSSPPPVCIEPPKIEQPPMAGPWKKEIQKREKSVLPPKLCPKQTKNIESRLSERANPGRMTRIADKLQWMKETGNYKGSPLTLDLDGDGKLTDADKQTFALNGDNMLAVDTNGNGLYQSASSKTKNGETRNVTDVWFNMEEVA